MLNFIKVVQIDGVFVNTEDLSHCFVKEEFFKLYYNKQSGVYSEYWSSGCDFID